MIIITTTSLQSTDTYFAPVAPPGKLDEKYLSSWIWPICSTVQKACHHKNWKYITSSEKDQTMATCNTMKIVYPVQSSLCYNKIWNCGFWDRRVYRQANRHADRNTSPTYRGTLWHSGTTLDLRSTGLGFKSYSGQNCETTLGKLFTPMCLCHRAL